MARTLPKQNAVIETSEAQIAVHWREEEYVLSLREICRAGKSDRSRHQRTLQREKFPGMLPRVRRPVDLGQVLGHHA